MSETTVFECDVCGEIIATQSVRFASISKKQFSRDDQHLCSDGCVAAWARGLIETYGGGTDSNRNGGPYR